MAKKRKDPNILLIVIDAVRARNLGCYGYSKPTSPNIDRLAKDGILFEDSYSCTNVTDASLTTILSGKYLLSHGIISHGPRLRREAIQRLDEYNISLLPQILRLRGYTTLAVDWLGRWHRRGFDYYSGPLHPMTYKSPRNWYGVQIRRMKKHIMMMSRRYTRALKSTAIDDATFVTSHAKNLLQKNCNRKFFLFLHYWDTHSPYSAPESFYEILEKRRTRKIPAIFEMAARTIRGERDSLARVQTELSLRYDASIAYIDNELGRLLSCLETLGILDKTLIILTSDHGESLTEHKIYFDHHCLYDVSIHVPLIIRHSKLPKSRRVKGFVQHFDIVPTIFDILGIESKDSDGKSCLPLVHEKTNLLHPAVYAEEAYWQRKRTIRTSNYKYIHALSRKGAICKNCKCIHGGVKELYDLREDPGETNNIIKEKPDEANMLQKRLTEWLTSINPKHI